MGSSWVLPQTGLCCGHEGEWARGQVGGWQLPSSTKSLMLELRVITQHQDIVGEDGPSRPHHVIATSSGTSPALGTPARLSLLRGQEAGPSLPLWSEGEGRAGARGALPASGAEDKLRPTVIRPASWAGARHLSVLQSRGLSRLPCAFCLINYCPVVPEAPRALGTAPSPVHVVAAMQVQEAAGHLAGQALQRQRVRRQGLRHPAAPQVALEVPLPRGATPSPPAGVGACASSPPTPTPTPALQGLLGGPAGRALSPEQPLQPLGLPRPLSEFGPLDPTGGRRTGLNY